MKILVALTFLCCLTTVSFGQHDSGSTQAAVVFGNLGQAENGALSDSSYNLTSTRWAAIGFQINTNLGQWYGLQTVKIGLVGVGDVKLSLYDASGAGGAPGIQIGSITDTKSVSDENNPSLLTYTLDQGTSNGGAYAGSNWSQLSANIPYWFVAERPNGNVLWVANLNGTLPTEFTPTGSLSPTPSGWTHLGNLVSTDAGSTWETPSGANAPIIQALSISVTAVPEPSTYALLLLSGAASLWALKLRKS